MRKAVVAAAVALMASAALAQQDFGDREEQDYAAQLWQAMADRDLAGDSAIHSFPYSGTDPHGVILETFYTAAEIDGHRGALIIKRNYGPQGVTIDQVLANPSEHLGAVTIMFARESGYASESGNWFWAKYLPDGSLDKTPDGVEMAGKVPGCISCHSGAGGGDYLFTTDASLN